MFRTLFTTSNDRTQAILRLMLGITFFAHGAQLYLGWFGGPGWHRSFILFGHLGIPTPLAFLAMTAEFFGGIGLLIGFLSRIAAFGILVNMLVAIFHVNGKFGFFINWFGTQKGNGIEFHLLVIVIGLAILIKGAGAFSLDHWISSRTPAQVRASVVLQNK